MSIKNWKRRNKRIEDEALENARKVFWGVKYPKWDWTRRGSWHSQPIKRHPGWAAYHANKDKD